MWAPSRAVRLQQRQGSAAPAAYGEASCSRPCATAGPAAAVPARTSFTLTSETCRQAVCQPARSPGWQGRGRRRGGSAVVPAAWRERTYRGGGGGAEGFGPGSSMNSEEVSWIRAEYEASSTLASCSVLPGLAWLAIKTDQHSPTGTSCGVPLFLCDCVMCRPAA